MGENMFEQQEMGIILTSSEIANLHRQAGVIGVMSYEGDVTMPQPDSGAWQPPLPRSDIVPSQEAVFLSSLDPAVLCAE